MTTAPAPVIPLHAQAPPVRVVTAASLFDGHDAAINIMRRLLQARGAEVIHLGHDRSVDEIVDAAVQEDADAVAISSYQGGHMEFFHLPGRAAAGARAFPTCACTAAAAAPSRREEIEALQAAGVARIFSPEDGRSLGLEGMIDSILEECRAAAPATARRTAARELIAEVDRLERGRSRARRPPDQRPRARR